MAAVVLWRIVNYYMFSPWTRDGHVRADVIQVAPDVAGLITSVQVADNQEVKRGKVLFVIDQARYALAERLADATLAQRARRSRRRSASTPATCSSATWSRASRSRKAARASNRAKPPSPMRRCRSTPRS